MTYFWFQLWREWKLSVAELINFFPKSEIIFCGSWVLILGNIEKSYLQENFYKLGWTIKIFELDFFANIEDIYESILETALNTEWKFKYSLNLFWEKIKNSSSFCEYIRFLLLFFIFGVINV